MSEPRTDEFDQFLEEYGLVRPPRYLSEDAAPPVDEDRLRALARGELDSDECHEVYALIAMFRSWDEGYARINKELEHLELQTSDVANSAEVGAKQKLGQARAEGRGAPTLHDKGVSAAVADLPTGGAGDEPKVSEGSSPVGTVELAGSTVIGPSGAKAQAEVAPDLAAQIVHTLRELSPALVQVSATLQRVKEAQSRPAATLPSRSSERWFAIAFGVLLLLLLLILVALAILVGNALTVNRNAGSDLPKVLALGNDDTAALKHEAELKALRKEVGAVQAKLGQAQHDLEALTRPNKKQPLHRSLLTIRGHEGPVTAVSYFSGGKRLATASLDGSVSIWDVSETHEREVVTFNAFSEVRSMVVVGDGRWIAAACGDGNVRAWDVEKKQLLFTRQGLAVAGSPAGDVFAIVSKDGVAQILSLPSGKDKSQFRLLAEGLSVSAISFCILDKTGMHLAIGFKANKNDAKSVSESLWQQNVWEASNGKITLALAKGTYDSSCCTYSSDGAFLVLSIARPQTVWFQPTLPVPVLGLEKSTKDAGTMIEPGEIGVLDATTGTKQKILKNADALRCVGITPDAKYVLGGTVKGGLAIWEVASEKQVHQLDCHHAEVLAVAIRPDGEQIATAGADGLVRMWDFRSLRETQK